MSIIILSIMDIDLIQWNLILLVSISSWLSQFLIADALQVDNKNNNQNNSCEENSTLTWLDSARKQWPSVPFEPYDLSSQSEFTPLVTTKATPASISSDDLKFGPSKDVPETSHKPSPEARLSSQLINPSRSITRFLVSTLSPSMPLTSTPPYDFHLTPSIELINSNNENPEIAFKSPSVSSSTSSPIEPTSPIFELLSSSQISTVNNGEAIKKPPFASRTVIPDEPASHYHGQQPSGSQLNYRVTPTATTTTPATNILPDFAVSTIKYNNRFNISKEPSLSSSSSSKTILQSIDSPSPPLLNQPNHSEINNLSSESQTNLSLSSSPQPASSYFPVLSGTISIITSDSSTESLTTDYTLTRAPIDNSDGNHDNKNDSATQNLHYSGEFENSLNHHGIPEAATSNTSTTTSTTTKCDPSENRLSQPAPESGFLVRSVLQKPENVPLNMGNLTSLLESRLTALYHAAYQNQLNGLGVSSEAIVKKDIQVKLWNLIWDNSSTHFNLIYSIELDNHKLLARDFQTLLSHVSPDQMTAILGYNVTIKAEPYVNTRDRKSNSLASLLENLAWLPLAMIILSIIVFIFCSLLTLIAWRKNRRLRSSSSSGALASSSSFTGPVGIPGSLVGGGLGAGKHSKGKHSATSSAPSKPTKVINAKDNLVNWRKVSGPGSSKSFLGSHGGSGTGLNLSGGCSATSGTIDSNHEFEYLSFDSPHSSLNLKSGESYRSRRPPFTSSFQSHGGSSQSRIELAKEKIIPIGELDEIAELSSNGSSHDHFQYSHHHNHHHHPNHNQSSHAITPSSRVTYVTTKEEMIGDYENPLMRPGIDEVDCSVPQLIQVQISEQTQNIIQAIRSELKKFNPITGNGSNNVQSQSQSSTDTATTTTTQFKESTSTSDA